MNQTADVRAGQPAGASNARAAAAARCNGASPAWSGLQW